MVGVAQQAEHWVVAPGVEGSNPFTHLILAFGCQLLAVSQKGIIFLRLKAKG